MVLTPADRSSQSLYTLRQALEAFEHNNVSLGKSILDNPGPHSSHLIGEGGVYYQMWTLKKHETFFSRFARRFGEETFKDTQNRHSSASEKAQAIKLHLDAFFRDESMRLQGTVKTCSATPNCATFHEHIPPGKTLVHLLAPSGEYVHAFQHQRLKKDEADEIRFREPYPEGHSTTVLTAIPGFDYKIYGYEKIGVRWIDPYNDKERADALDAQVSIKKVTVVAATAISAASSEISSSAAYTMTSAAKKLKTACSKFMKSDS